MVATQTQHLRWIGQCDLASRHIEAIPFVNDIVQLNNYKTTNECFAQTPRNRRICDNDLLCNSGDNGWPVMIKPNELAVAKRSSPLLCCGLKSVSNNWYLLCTLN